MRSTGGGSHTIKTKLRHTKTGTEQSVATTELFDINLVLFNGKIDNSNTAKTKNNN